MTNSDIAKGYAEAWKALFQGFCNSLAYAFVVLPVFNEGDDVDVLCDNGEHKTGKVRAMSDYFSPSPGCEREWHYVVQYYSALDGHQTLMEPSFTVRESQLSRADGEVFGG